LHLARRRFGQGAMARARGTRAIRRSVKQFDQK
jgi:hypothetical protein